ncbi:hypothetical protein [Streptococcus thoraltensis]
MHKILQVAFPEIENLLSAPTGEQYGNIVTLFPTKHEAMEVSEVELREAVRQSMSKRISENRLGRLVEKMSEMAKQSYPTISKTRG